MPRYGGKWIGFTVTAASIWSAFGTCTVGTCLITLSYQSQPQKRKFWLKGVFISASGRGIRPNLQLFGTAASEVFLAKFTSTVNTVTFYRPGIGVFFPASGSFPSHLCLSLANFYRTV